MKVAFVGDDERFVSVQKGYLARATQEIGVSCEVFTFLYILLFCVSLLMLRFCFQIGFMRCA